MALKRILVLTLLFSALSLIVVYVAQYGYGLHPCELCHLQRVPYALVIAAAALGIYARPLRVALVVIIGLLFLAGGGIATYHAGVEKGWIKGPSSCTDADGAEGESLEDFRNKILRAPVVACDRPEWEFYGITMAVLNMLWSFFLSGFTFRNLLRRYA